MSKEINQERLESKKCCGCGEPVNTVFTIDLSLDSANTVGDLAYCLFFELWERARKILDKPYDPNNVVWANLMLDVCANLDSMKLYLQAHDRNGNVRDNQ